MDFIAHLLDRMCVGPAQKRVSQFDKLRVDRHIIPLSPDMHFPILTENRFKRGLSSIEKWNDENTVFIDICLEDSYTDFVFQTSLVLF